MRIGKKKKKKKHAHTKSFARLVDSENWSKEEKVKHKKKHAHKKSVARLVDGENWSKKYITINNNNTCTQKVLLDFSIVRIGLKQNIKNNKNYNTQFFFLRVVFLSSFFRPILTID